MKYKDPCDKCKKYDYLTTINNMCLCKKCGSNIVLNSEDNKKIKQISLDDYKGGKRHDKTD